MAAVNCLVPNILQNIFFVLNRKKKHVLNNLRVSKWYQGFYFRVNCPFKANIYPW